MAVLFADLRTVYSIARASGKPGHVAISDDQVNYVAQVLAQYPEVRWTTVLMHKPAWEYHSAGFAQLEKLLDGRDYSVLAGHDHYYGYSKRRGRDYIKMATTGGIWLKDGAGRRDHIGWVTMTDDGPVFASIDLDGVFDKRGAGTQGEAAPPE